jgi:uncharacterized protein (TIGR03435 family)
MMVRTFCAIALVTAGLVEAAQFIPTFEVASVKRAAGGGPPGDIARNMDPSPGSFAMRNVPLRLVLEWAYDVKRYQIFGPPWIDNEERYDIVAKAPGPALNDQMKLMLQALLTERFRVRLHREKRVLPVYVLLRGKSEPKLKPGDPRGTPTQVGTPTEITFKNQPIARLAFMLTARMDRPVLDMTGIEGVYDYIIETGGLGFNGQPAADPTAGPSIFTAVQDNLGLRLESQRAPIEVLVIDAVQRIPVQN